MTDALQNRDLEHFVRAFALFQQRFLHGPDAAAAPRPPAAMAAAPVAAAGAPPRCPAPAKPRRAA